MAPVPWMSGDFTAYDGEGSLVGIDPDEAADRSVRVGDKVVLSGAGIGVVAFVEEHDGQLCGKVHAEAFDVPEEA